MKKINNLINLLIVLTHLFFFKIFLKIFNLNLCILISKKKIFGIYINRKSLVQILDKNFNNFPKFTCLIKCLTFKRLVRNSENYKCCIGIKNQNKNFESHAWIEFKGKKILNILPDIDQFKVIHSYE